MEEHLSSKIGRSCIGLPLLLASRLIGQLLLQKDRNDEDIPEVVYTLYDFSHSFVTSLILFASRSLVKKEWSVLALAYGLHIACDISFHDSRSSTRFLYPISTFHIHGYSYAEHKWVMGMQYPLLLGIYAALILRQERDKS